jgi:Xaa-Pro aminopeptidase
MESHRGLTAEFFGANRARLRELFGRSDPIVLAGNCLIQESSSSTYPFVQNSNVWYLSGIQVPGIILVMEASSEYIIVPKRDPVRAAFDGQIDHSSLQKISGVDTVYEWKEGWSRLEKLVKKSTQIAGLKPGPSYIESHDMFTNPSPARLLALLSNIRSSVDLVDITPYLRQQRMKKQPQELRLMKSAIAHTVKVFETIETNRKKVTNESQLHALAAKYTIENDLSFAYSPIIAAGSNSVVLHYQQNNQPINSNALLLDIGLKYQGYCADITRTVFENPTPRQQQVYDAVLAVHNFACSLLKPGTNLKTYEQAVQHYLGEKLQELGLIRTLSKASVRKYYPQLTSHFLGIDAHDLGDYDAPLDVGTVLTVEPAIYIAEEGLGIRLEDEILITDNGNENLTRALPKNSHSLTIDQR